MSARAAARRRTERRSDLGPRLLAAIPAVVFAIFIVTQGGLIFAIGVLLLGWVCLHELYTLTGGLRPVRLAGFLAVTGLVFTALYGTQFHVLLAAVAAFPLVFGLALVPSRREGTSLSMSVTLLGVFWIGLAIAHAVMLRELELGDQIVVDVLVGTFIGDTGAYVGGRLFGSRPLAPSISPNKTVEGLVIGMITAVVATWFAGLYQNDVSGTQALLLGLGVAVAAPVGDLFESVIKRDYAAKDAGRLFGAHGGALDRLDAALFTLPVAYYVWSALT